MTEAKKPDFLYLNRPTIEHLHASLSAWAIERGDEPIPPFSKARIEQLDSLVEAPRRRFEGRDMYPTLEEKAAIVFYSINKQQIFLNGNKRMSTLCLLVFLAINDKWLQMPPDELTAKALWLANTPSLDFPRIKQELAEWIREHLIELPDSLK